MKKLWKFTWDCGRMGQLDGLFIADEAEVQAIIGKHVEFGEVLGKFSDVGGPIEEGEIVELTDDQDFLEQAEALLGTSISGYNPLDYYDPENEG